MSISITFGYSWPSCGGIATGYGQYKLPLAANQNRCSMLLLLVTKQKLLSQLLNNGADGHPVVYYSSKPDVPCRRLPERSELLPPPQTHRPLAQTVVRSLAGARWVLTPDATLGRGTQPRFSFSFLFRFLQREPCCSYSLEDRRYVEQMFCPRVTETDSVFQVSNCKLLQPG